MSAIAERLQPADICRDRDLGREIFPVSSVAADQAVALAQLASQGL